MQKMTCHPDFNTHAWQEEPAEPAVKEGRGGEISVKKLSHEIIRICLVLHNNVVILEGASQRMNSHYKFTKRKSGQGRQPAVLQNESLTSS